MSDAEGRGAALNHAEQLLQRDRKVVWHPYTQHGRSPSLLPVVGAHESRLTLADGREVIDGISSWWTCLHGHGHPALVKAMQSQVTQLDHVLFAGCTHEPAVALAERLVEVSPDGLSRVFFSDDGSTAVEVGLKMVIQRWRHEGQPERRVFINLEGAYHGDTFGAMSVGETDPFFTAFRPLLFESRTIPVNIEALKATLKELGASAAAVIVEPLVQGAAGMVMHSEEFLRDVRAACDEAAIPLIADEVMTGFGRTGALFACDRAGVAPDVLCLSKGLTGGCFPLAVTLTTERMFDAFWSDDPARMFFHGHTFTGHPVGCAVALASVNLAVDGDVAGRLDAIGARIEGGLRSHGVHDSPGIADVRRTGGIVALTCGVEGDENYLSTRLSNAPAVALEHGVLLRPMGPVLYALPPASTTDEECDRIVEAMVAVLNTQS